MSKYKEVKNHIHVTLQTFIRTFAKALIKFQQLFADIIKFVKGD